MVCAQGHPRPSTGNFGTSPWPQFSLTTSFPSIHLNLSIDDSTHEPLSTSLQNQMFYNI
ncbi:hypothetical protein CROQUDRAFT_655223, partial [Cronartium quercuum f. sp. fusiforme G11]